MATTLHRTSSWAPSIDPKCPSLPSSSHSPQTLLLKPSLSVKARKAAAFTVKASLVEADSGVSGRRQALLGVGALIATILPISGNAVAAKAPKGFQAVLDNFDNYEFLYPFGWQEVSVKGQDCVYKDVIEPLESVSVNIIDTDKSDVHDLGSPEEVAQTLVGKVLAAPSQKTQLLAAKERVTEGKTYYTFEFLAKASNYTRHAVGTITIANGKFYTLTTGANERRWGKMQDKLKAVADSFSILK